MRNELQRQLVEQYPDIFEMVGSDPRDSAMAWGIECGDGWFDILDHLCRELTRTVETIDRLHPEYKFRVKAVQVKEKYGTLRFYVDFHYDENINDEQMKRLTSYMDRISGAISFAESMTARTCEDCGARATMNPDEPFPIVLCRACETTRYDARWQTL